MESTIITLQIITLVLSAIAPLITAVSGFISHISKSECFGNKIVMRVPDKTVEV